MKLSNRQAIAGLAGFASFVWLSLTAAVAARQTSIIFNPIPGRGADHPRSDSHRSRHVVLRTADGERLCGWLLTPNAPGPHPGVLYFGGRSEEVSWVLRDAQRMFPGMTVLAMNYRGYGGSSGIPGERELMSDAEMLWDWLAGHYRVDPQRIAIVGRSLGSGVAVQVAASRPVTSLVLITPYDSLVSLARRRFRTMPVSWLLRHRFESTKYAANLQVHTLVLRAEQDDIVPGSHTDAFIASLPIKPLDTTIAGSDHCTVPYLEASQQAVAGFLRQAFEQRVAPVPRIEPDVAGTAIAAAPTPAIASAAAIDRVRAVTTRAAQAAATAVAKAARG